MSKRWFLVKSIYPGERPVRGTPWPHVTDVVRESAAELDCEIIFDDGHSVTFATFLNDEEQALLDDLMRRVAERADAKTVGDAFEKHPTARHEINLGSLYHINAMIGKDGE